MKASKQQSIRCDQCEAASINGVFCHETGCPNTKSRYDHEADTWVKQRKCFECGCTVDADDPCCNAPMEDDEASRENVQDEASQQTLDQFITKHNLKFECHRVDARPDSGTEWDSLARHFRCRIFARIQTGQHKKSMGLYFSQGAAHTGDPTLSDVLDCLASDASGYENAGTPVRGTVSTDDVFHNWAEEYGYDTDSRQAEKTFKAIKRQAEQLKRTIGEAAYQELLWNTERL